MPDRILTTGSPKWQGVPSDWGARPIACREWSRDHRERVRECLQIALRKFDGPSAPLQFRQSANAERKDGWPPPRDSQRPHSYAGQERGEVLQYVLQFVPSITGGA